MTNLNLCIDCKWMDNTVTMPVCKRTRTVNPVTGETQFSFCTIERIFSSLSNSCGVEGRFFERKEQ